MDGYWIPVSYVDANIFPHFNPASLGNICQLKGQLCQWDSTLPYINMNPYDIKTKVCIDIYDT